MVRPSLHGLDVLVAQHDGQRGAGSSSAGRGDFHVVLQTEQVDVDIHDVAHFQLLGGEGAAFGLLLGEDQLVCDGLVGAVIITVSDGQGQRASSADDRADDTGQKPGPVEGCACLLYTSPSPRD